MHKLTHHSYYEDYDSIKMKAATNTLGQQEMNKHSRVSETVETLLNGKIKDV